MNFKTVRNLSPFPICISLFVERERRHAGLVQLDGLAAYGLGLPFGFSSTNYV